MSSIPHQALCIILDPSVNSNWSYSPETPNLVRIWRFFLALWPCNLTYDLEKQLGTSSILLQALCIISYPLVNSNWSYSPETPNLDQNRWFFSRVTLQFDVWPWKTIGHLFYSTSSFVHHFVAIGEFKLELQSENAQFGSNSTIFRALWPWNLTPDLDCFHGRHFCHW